MVGISELVCEHAARAKAVAPTTNGRLEYKAFFKGFSRKRITLNIIIYLFKLLSMSLMGFRQALSKFSLSLLALFTLTCSPSGGVIPKSELHNTSQNISQERRMPYFPAAGYKRVDENTWFTYNAGLPYLRELEGRSLTWRGALSYNTGEFIVVTENEGNDLETPKVIHIDSYGNPQILFDENFPQKFDQISLVAQDYGVDDMEEEVALVMQYDGKDSVMIIDPKRMRPVFWYENDGISLADHQGRLIIGKSRTQGHQGFEAYKWNGEKYVRIEVPKEISSGTQRHVVFVAGMCSNNPKDPFNEINEWLVREMGYAHSELDYFNYKKGGASGGTYDEDDTLKSIDDEGGSAENFRDFLKSRHEEWPDTEFDVIAHSLGGVVALYALNRYPELQGIIHSVTTINSPLQGLDTVKFRASKLAPCTLDFERRHREQPPVLVDIKEDSGVISTISQADYSKGGSNIETIANSNDIVVSSPGHKSGEAGVLDAASGDMISFGLEPPIGMVARYPSFVSPFTYAHVGPLKIESLEEFGKHEQAEFMKRSLEIALKSE